MSIPDDRPLERIEAFRDLRPISRGRRPRRLLAASAPPRRLRDMDDAAIEAWTGGIVDGMASQMRSHSES